MGLGAARPPNNGTFTTRGYAERGYYATVYIVCLSLRLSARLYVRLSVRNI